MNPTNEPALPPRPPQPFSDEPGKGQQPVPAQVPDGPEEVQPAFPTTYPDAPERTPAGPARAGA